MSDVETRPASEPAASMERSPAAEQTAQQAGELALSIAELGMRHSRLSALTRGIADLLLDALDLEAAAFFWCRPRERTRDHSGERRRALLHNTALAQRPDGASGDTARRAKLLAYRALLRDAPLERALRVGQGTATLDVLALPIGSATPWAVLVVAFRPWDGAGEPDVRQAVLMRLSAALATVTRAAHMLDEASRSEHQHSPRRAILVASSEAILTIGDDLTVQEINPAFAKVTGWTERTSVGRHCSEIIHCRDEHKVALCETPACPLRTALSSEGGIVVRELSWQTRTGRTCDVSASFAVQGSGTDARTLVVARDVATLHAANRMRSNFISMVSHELRTPLNTINGFLEIVLDGQVGPLNERQREFLGYAHTSTQQLTTLVEDILLISKADSGQFTLRKEDVSLAEVVARTMQAVQQAAEKAEVGLTADVPATLPEFRADELRIQQVLTNLLGNAIKFTPEGGSVRVVAEEAGAELCVSVSDTGRGVAPEDQSRIFERFYQSEASLRQRTGGYGLGLAIAKLIVEQHGGRIWVESKPGEGAIFSFTLPLEDEPQ